MVRKTVAVIDIGRVGLPLRLVIAEEKYKVYGIGRNEIKNKLLKKDYALYRKGAIKLKKLVNKTFSPQPIIKSYKILDIVILTSEHQLTKYRIQFWNKLIFLDAIIPYVHEKQLIDFRSTVSPSGQTKYIVKRKNREPYAFKSGRSLYLALYPRKNSSRCYKRKYENSPKL